DVVLARDASHVEVEHRARVVGIVRSEDRDALRDLRVVHRRVHPDERSALDTVERDTAAQRAARKVRMRARHGPGSNGTVERREGGIHAHRQHLLFHIDRSREADRREEYSNSALAFLTESLCHPYSSSAWSIDSDFPSDHATANRA